MTREARTRDQDAPMMAPEDYSHLPTSGQRLVSVFRERFVRLVADRDPASILEVGCGQGWLTAELAKALPNARIVGIEIRPEAVAYARSLVPTAEFFEGDAHRLPFGDASFDAVVSSEMLEHVARPEVALDEIVRVGRGFSVLSVPHEPWFRLANLARLRYLATLGNHPGHLHHWGPGSFGLFVGTRFDEVVVERSFPWLLARATRRS